MENKEQKTPEQWFQALKEPYRSQAIAGINKEVLHFKEYPESLLDALYFSLHWGEPYKTTRNDWDDIYKSIKDGETTYLEINTDTLKPEPIELKPEDLVSGEVYSYINVGNEKSILHFNGKIKGEEVYYHVKKHENGKIRYNDWVNVRGKFYYATKEEKDLLLGKEETTDWKAKFEELTQTCNELTQIIADLKLELSEKYEKQNNQGEKVYFYYNEKKEHISFSESLEIALKLSPHNHDIYEAVCIGKKKSVLVNETT